MLFLRLKLLMQTIETFSVRFLTGSRKLLLRVCSFTLPRFPILVGRSFFSTAMFVFRQVEVHHFYRPKNRNNSFIRVKKSNKHVADGYRKLLRVFKREAVQFLVAKILAVSHLQLEALPAVQTWTANCKPDRKTLATWHSQVLRFSMKTLMRKVKGL